MGLFDLFKRTELSDRQEAAVNKTLNNLRAQRRSRFRSLACIDGSEESLITVRFAARLAVTDNCDIVILFVRPIDMGLHSGGLQVRLARQNMIDAGFQLPGVSHLKHSLEVLKEEGLNLVAGPVTTLLSETFQYYSDVGKFFINEKAFIKSNPQEYSRLKANLQTI